eukprot:CAMPEP_0177565660 /NCGR_PEP_ID=MMETSP0369-20130122/74259_1 /TAXON_ID=447022 ORGANISM="Scrippsiella hangoei-like, Strain SHHI-4" /NCGR_SAMPLE_ID=MMETSP0369 /ASSEMBLY_ACC=CAM_ASM_000364 /LENGTH=538 /DNA_ID=CAMNT_0019053013 /DNA_START=53 /DNA_END=1666 /DNA_ORIENTATION=+
MAADAACVGMATPGVVLKVEVSGCFYRLPVSAPASLEDAEKALHSLHLTRHGVLCEADAGWRNLTPESWAGAVAVVSARLPADSATDISEARRPVVVRLRAAAHAVAAAAEEAARAAETAAVGLEAPPTTSPECPSASPALHAAAPPPTAAQQLPEPSAPPPTPEEPAAPVGEPEEFDMAAEDSSDEAMEERDLDSNGRGPQLISVGAMLEAVSPVVVREHEMLCEGSPILRRLPAGAHVQVLRLGSDPGGRRVFVRDEYGIDGWASVVSMEGGRLLRPARSRGQSDRPEGAGQPQGAPVRDLHALLRERHDLNRAEAAFAPPTRFAASTPQPQHGGQVAADAVVHFGAVVMPGATIESGAQLHGGCFVGPGARIGRGTQVHGGARVEEGAVVGNLVRLHGGSVVAAGAHIGDGAHIHGAAKVGPHAVVGARCQVHGGSHIGPRAELGPECVLHGGCKIGPGAALGRGVTMLGGSHAAEQATVAAGSTIRAASMSQPSARTAGVAFAVPAPAFAEQLVAARREHVAAWHVRAAAAAVA